MVLERHGGGRRDQGRRPEMRWLAKRNAQPVINIREENQQIDYLARADKRAIEESSCQIRAAIKECRDTSDWASDGADEKDEQSHWRAQYAEEESEDCLCASAVSITEQLVSEGWAYEVVGKRERKG